MTQIPNQQQQEIILSSPDRPLIITAGAGTGKTTTLTDRFVHIFGKHKIKPDNILLLTFTNKAANEMKERILKKTNFAFSERENLWIHTFHSFCARILKEEAFSLNISPDFEPLDTAEQKLLFRTVYNELITISGDFQELKEELAVIRNTDLRSFSDDILKTIEFLRDRLVNVDEYWNHFRKNNSLDQRSVMERIIYCLYRRFDSVMNDLEAKDFPKLISDVVFLLQKYPSIRKKYQKKFKFIMVDEFQDTNHSQFELIKLLSNESLSNLTIVGDPRQSIYQWRGADPSNLKWFNDNIKNSCKLSLTENYRSYGEILNFATEFISARYAESDKLKAAKGFYGKPAIFLHENPDGDAEFVAYEIKRLILEKKYKPDDIVILLRKTKDKVHSFEKALSCEGIPFYTSGAGSFFDKDEIKNILSYIRVIYNPLDKEPFCRLLMGYPNYLPESELYRIQRKAKINSVTFFEQASFESSLKGFCAEISGVSEMKDKISLIDMFYLIYDRFNLNKVLFDTPAEFTNRKENINKLINIMHKYSSRHSSSDIEDFIEYFNLAAHEAEDDAELERIQAQNCVKIMTLHKAKGLEFPVVFLSDLNILKESKNHQRSSFFVSDDLEFIFENSEEYEFFMKNKLQRELDELYRLYYVGITRARETLYLTGKKLDSFRESLCNLPAESWKEIINPISYPVETDFEFDEANFFERLGIIKDNIYNKIEIPDSTRKTFSLNCSTLHEFIECPYKFYLGNILKVPIDENEGENDIRWDKIGTSIHSIIEDYHTLDKKVSIENLAEIKIDGEKNIKEEIIKDCLDYYKTTDYYTDSSENFISEYSFVINIDNIELRGQIDRLYIKDGICRIIDFKTGFMGGVDKYLFQMELYSIACKKLFKPEQIQVELVFLNQKKIEIIKIDENILVKAEDLLKNIAEKIESGNLSHKKSYLCNYCLYKESGKCEIDINEKDFFDIDSYYLKFYELLNCEEKECIDTKDQEITPITFNRVIDCKEKYSIVEYFVEPYFLRYRQGDFVNLKGEDDILQSAQIADIGKNTINFFVNGLKDWKRFNYFCPFSDPLTYSRMKDNLMDFYMNESPLKELILRNKLPEYNELKEELGNISVDLDSYQAEAIQYAANAKDMMIIQGPPGTGKTLTIVHLVKELVQKGNRVLVCAYTNRALDAILIKITDLISDSRFVAFDQIARVGRTPMVHNILKEKGIIVDESLSGDCLTAELESKIIVGVTSAGIYSRLFEKKFDCAIIDEASQMPEPYALGVVNNTNKLVLVGDDKQLPPIIQSVKALNGGLGISLFERMRKYFQENNANSVLMLKNQYRMNQKLIEFPSKAFYNGEIKTGNMKVGLRKLSIDVTGKKIHRWIESVLDPEEPLVYVDLKGNDKPFACIGCIIDIVLKGFMVTDIKPEDIGIISPYRHEVSQIRKMLKINKLDIDTIDRFQGSDKEVIILSSAMKDGGLPELLKDPNRFNVALTRAKSKLIVVGDMSLIDNIKESNYYNFIEFIRQSGKIIVME